MRKPVCRARRSQGNRLHNLVPVPPAVVMVAPSEAPRNATAALQDDELAQRGRQ
jgi:hypothetical protein